MIYLLILYVGQTTANVYNFIKTFLDSFAWSELQRIESVCLSAWFILSVLVLLAGVDECEWVGGWCCGKKHWMKDGGA